MRSTISTRGEANPYRVARWAKRDKVGAVDHESLADIPEEDLVYRLVRDRYWWSSVFDLAGFPPDPVIVARLRQEDIPPGNYRGDVDVLLCARNAPALATAIEVKRVKVKSVELTADGFLEARPNKLGDVAEGIRQANQLAKIGFSQVYLYVFVVVDTREQNSGEKSYADLSPKLRGQLDRAISPDGLEPRVGLLRGNFLQPKNESPLVGASSLHFIRGATATAQPAELTTWVARKLRLAAKRATAHRV